MDYYALYLDESIVDNQFFSVGGVIVAKHKRKQVRADLRKLKNDLWSDYEATEEEKNGFILHELAVNQFKRVLSKNVPRLSEKHGAHNAIFRSTSKVTELYAGLANILDYHQIPVMAVTLDTGKLTNYYSSDAAPRGYEMAIQIITENFVQFLITHNGYGDIVLESRSDVPTDKSDFSVQSKFYSLKANGTMFITDELIQKHLGRIEFQPKTKNREELQLADFVPNNFARKMAGKQVNTLGRTLLNRRYDGGQGKPDRFGNKQIP